VVVPALVRPEAALPGWRGLPARLALLLRKNLEGNSMAICGSCHCGAVAYTLDDDPREAMECTCSICRRKGYLLAFSAPDRFMLETPRDALAVCAWNQHVVRHHFCRTCGCEPFGEGTAPDGTARIAVNLRRAEGLDLGRLRITAFDGASL
jgi:hypothetical protein